MRYKKLYVVAGILFLLLVVTLGFSQNPFKPLHHPKFITGTGTAYIDTIGYSNTSAPGYWTKIDPPKKGPLHMKYDSLKKAYDSVANDDSNLNLVVKSWDVRVFAPDTVAIPARVPRGYIQVEYYKYRNLVWLLLCFPIVCVFVGVWSYNRGKTKGYNQGLALPRSTPVEQQSYKYVVYWIDSQDESYNLKCNHYSYNAKTKVLTANDGGHIYKEYGVKLTEVTEDLGSESTEVE